MAQNWRDVIGKFVTIEQEVLLDGLWSELQFSGWVACFIDGTLAMDNGEEWVVEDNEQFVRNSKLLPCTSLGLPKWQRFPDKWTPTPNGWEKNPVAPKLEGCNCANCSLYENVLVDDKERTKECDVLFCGEAPGYTEQQEGRFFVGRAGKLLRALEAQTGIGKFRVGHNNTCVCYASETPTDEDIRACKARLMREIRLANPKLVVAVGGIALQALTGMLGITEHQGLLMDWSYPDEGVGDAQGVRHIKLLPCFHSAAVLRRPDLFYTFAETIYKAALFLQGNTDLDVQPKDFDVQVVREELEKLEGGGVKYSFGGALAVLSQAERLYVDLETTDYSPYKDKIICVAVSYALEGKASRRSYVFPWSLIQAHFKEFKQLLETVPSNYWNAFFDAQFLRQNGIKPNIEGDIMLKHYTLDETPLSQGLKSTARRYCNAPDWEEPLRQYLPNRSTSFAVIPPEVLYPYNGYDSGYTGVLDDVISARMDDNNRRVYSTILIPALKMFLDTCDVGMRVDVGKLSSLRVELQKKMVDIQQQLEETVRDSYRAELRSVSDELESPSCTVEKKVELEQQAKVLHNWVDGKGWFNPSSIKDARHLVYDVLGIETDSESTSRTTLEDFKGVTGVDLLLQFRETRKLLGTYIEGLVDDLVGEDVVHPNIRLNGTVTGRLSSNNPNFFGIPDEKGGIKKLYKARYDGWGIGNGDGAQMEIRTLGALSNDRQMIDDFVRGVDFHGAARDRLYRRGTDKKNYNHQEVLDAKTAVFGPIYGRGAESLAQQFYHSELAALKAAGQSIRWPTWASLPPNERTKRIAQAQEHINELWEPYPTALNWLKENVKKAQEDGELVSYYSRYRHWGLITDEVLEDLKTSGRNFPVQSASSDTNLLVMHGSYKKFPREVYLPIFPVHDSVVFMYKLGEESWLVPQLKEHFEKRAQELLCTDMKFVYSFSTGPSWGEQKEWEGE